MAKDPSPPIFRAVLGQRGRMAGPALSFIKHSLAGANQHFQHSNGPFFTLQAQVNPVAGQKAFAEKVSRSRTATASRDENLEANFPGGGGRVKGGTEAAASKRAEP